MIVLSILEILVMFCLPVLIIWLTKKFKFLNNIGAIALCYLAGFIFALLPIEYDKSLSETVASAIVALAIPLVLFSFDLKSVKKLAKNVAVGYVLMIAAVAIASTVGAIAANSLGLKEASKLAGMATGLYTGGTPNLIAIGNALLSPDKKSLVISAATTSDFFVGGIYFLLILTVIRPVYRKFLPEKTAYSPTFNKNEKADGIDEASFNQSEYDFKSIPKDKRSILKLAGVILLAVAALGLGVLLEILINGNMSGSLFIMITVSLLGIIISFIKPIREVKGSYQVGQYLILVFSLGLSMSIDLGALAKEILPTLAFFACVQTASVILHLILCKIFKIDGGSAIITSTAGVYGPPFIAPVAEAYGDKDLIAPGVICGVSGLMIGNILGIALGGVLSVLL